VKTDMITVYKGWLIVQISLVFREPTTLGGLFVMIYELDGFNVEYGERLCIGKGLVSSF